MTWSDLTEDLNEAVIDAFGSDTVAWVGGSPLPGIFRHAYLDIDIGEVAEGGYAGRQPLLDAKASDCDALDVVRGTQLDIAGTTYIVRNIQQDDGGMFTLILEKQ